MLKEAMVEMQEVSCEHLVVDERPIGTLLPSVGRTSSDGTSQQLLGFDNHMLGSVLLEDLLGELCDGILAVGLDDGVGEALLHDKTLEMLNLMLCWPLLGRDDRAA